MLAAPGNGASLVHGAIRWRRPIGHRCRVSRLMILWRFRRHSFTICWREKPMKKRFLLLALAAIFTLQCAAKTPAPRLVDLVAPDGSKLKATYFAAGRPGPGVLLLHQCNRDRKMWSELAPRLADSGLNVLALDFRGYGDSQGTAPVK